MHIALVSYILCNRLAQLSELIHFYSFKVVVVSSQPQYRVFVDPPVIINGHADTTYVNCTLCFREVNISFSNDSYCSLGRMVYPINGTDEPPQTLDLGPGGNSLPPQFQGLGALATIEGIRNGTLYPIIYHFSTFGYRFPGAVGRIIGFLNVKFGVYCLPEFTGSNCLTSIATSAVTELGISTTVYQENPREIPTTPGIATTMYQENSQEISITSEEIPKEIMTTREVMTIQGSPTSKGN